MWFGSYNGLHKHEGTSVKVYNKSGKDTVSLSSKEMHAVFEDRLGFIWAGTTGGLDKLDPATGNILHYHLKPSGTDDERIGYVVSIFQDDKDNMWVVTNVAIFIVDYKTGNYTQVLDNEKSGRGMPNCNLLYKASVKTNTGIWMFASGYVIFFDFKSRQFFHQYNNPFHKEIFTLNENNKFNAPSELCTDNQNNLYFVYNSSVLVKYNVITEKLDSFHFDFPKNAWGCCYSLSADHKGNVWIGFRYGGLLFFDNDSHQFTPIRYTDANSLVQSDYVYSLCEDYLKRMWVTTNNGVFVINYYDSTVQQKYLSDKNEFININYKAGIISQDDKGNIYAPYYSGGLFKYNVLNASNRHFPVSDASAGGYGYVFAGDSDHLYIGNGRTLKLADTASHTIKLKVPAKPVYQLLDNESGSVAWVYKYNDDAIYFKKSNGIIYYYNGTRKLERIVSTGFSKQACVSDDHKFLYFLIDDGDLIKRDLVSLKMDTILLHKKLQVAGFVYANTRDIADDGSGSIWITSQNGLVKYNLATQNAKVYTTENGLLHDFSFALCKDSKNRLWVGSMGGVNLYDPVKDLFINVFTEAPDKLSNYFGSSLQAKDGHLYFLFGGKLVNVDPEGFFKQKVEARMLRLDEIAINGHSIAISEKGLAKLSHTQNRLYFRFGLLEFTEPEKVKYLYQLQGLDKGWINLGNHSEITFNSLQPANYVLRIKAVDGYGTEVKEQLVIPFTIQPPFWKTWWFLLGMAICFGLLIYWFVRIREASIKAIGAEKLKVEQLNAEQYKNKLELEQIVNYFSSSLIDKNTIDDVLWDVAKNLIGQLGFEDCMIYLWNDDKTKMIQKAGFGVKDSAEQIQLQSFEVQPGQGVVGFVMQTKEPVVIADTSLDSRYRADDLVRSSEIAVPLIYNNELIGVIDSEHHQKNFFTARHLQVLSTIATLVTNKIKSIEAEQSLQLTKIEMYSMGEQLSKARLEALRSQMNPHFIFNSLNAIQECILSNNVDAAYQYLSKFSKLQRMVLNNSEKEMIPLSSEVEMLQLYLSLESLRFYDSFTYKMDTSGILDLDEIMMPSLITQPLIENAIWHGLRNKEGEKTLNIKYEEKNGYLIILIEDNGVGRKEAGIIKQQKLGGNQVTSKATTMLSERLAVLGKQLHTEFLLEIIDMKDEAGTATGTKVILSFPVNFGQPLTESSSV